MCLTAAGSCFSFRVKCLHHLNKPKFLKVPVHNKTILNILNELADLLDIQGENQFRVRAYRNAIRSLSGFTGSIAEKVHNGEVSSLEGIGTSMSEKIKEIAETGELEQLNQLKKKVPTSLAEIMKLDQMGPHRTKLLYDTLNITTLQDLEKAAREGKIENVPGIGKKTSEKILREIEEFSDKGGLKRTKWSEAENQVNSLLNYLEGKMENVTVAGSFRRKKETVKDIDLVATSKNPKKAMRDFIGYDETERVVAIGETKSSVKLHSGIQVDLRIIEEESFGSAILYFTGSKEHTIVLRKMAQEKKLKLNEYGIFEKDKKLASKTEKELYNVLGLAYIEPEIRENKGEIEAAEKNKLPKLVTLDDIKGDLHTHTNQTDGLNSLYEMAEAMQNEGYEYYAVTDHSKRVSVANGLNDKRLLEQIEQIDELNGKMNKIKILKSIEVDILKDGSLDLPDSVLKELYFVLGSVHYHLNLSKKEQTKRVLKAMDNPHFNILGHPTGRMIGQRNAYEIDMRTILKAARENGCFLEINANPRRLDLNDDHARLTKEMGVKIAVSTDSHSTGSIQFMKYGINQARRGWLEKDDVLNTRSLKELRQLLKR